jgi:cell wall-associated NlpC family hydrolase
MLPAWASDYVGLPYSVGGRSREGVDCWGLYELIFNEQSGRTIPSYDGPVWGGEGATSREIALACAAFASRFSPVQPGEEQVFDGIIMRLAGHPLHVGMVIEPGWMIHSIRGADSCIERYRPSMVWENRIAGFHRHV